MGKPKTLPSIPAEFPRVLWYSGNFHPGAGMLCTLSETWCCLGLTDKTWRLHRMYPMYKFSIKSSSLRVYSMHLSARVESVRHHWHIKCFCLSSLLTHSLTLSVSEKISETFAELFIFTARVRIARNAERCTSYRDSVCLSVRLSVCPSVTFRYCVQTKEGMIVRFSASGRTIPLVSGEVKFIRIFAEDHPQRGR